MRHLLIVYFLVVGIAYAFLDELPCEYALESMMMWQ